MNDHGHMRLCHSESLDSSYNNRAPVFKAQRLSDLPRSPSQPSPNPSPSCSACGDASEATRNRARGTCESSSAINRRRESPENKRHKDSSGMGLRRRVTRAYDRCAEGPISRAASPRAAPSLLSSRSRRLSKRQTTRLSINSVPALGADGRDRRDTPPKRRFSLPLCHLSQRRQVIPHSPPWRSTPQFASHSTPHAIAERAG